MRRGTTPTHTFTTDIDLTKAEVIYLTYEQADCIKLTRDIDSMTVEEDKVVVTLTQEETLAFTAPDRVHIQIRARFPGETAIASNIIETSVEKVLKDGVI